MKKNNEKSTYGKAINMNFSMTYLCVDFVVSLVSYPGTNILLFYFNLLHVFALTD